MTYSNESRAYKRAVRFYREAVADGWDSKPAYPDEVEEQAAILTRKGYSLFILMRTKNSGFTGSWEYDTSVDGLGPDRLPIVLPKRYNWTDIKRALRTCGGCGARRVRTVQWNWRLRVCLDCFRRRSDEEEGREQKQQEEAMDLECLRPARKKVRHSTSPLGLFEEG